MKIIFFEPKITRMYTKFSLIILPIAFLLLWANCNYTTAFEPIPDGATEIQASEQRSGDAVAGRNYLYGGDYLNSGIPFDIYKSVPIFASNSPDDLGRTGDNKGIPFN